MAPLTLQTGKLYDLNLKSTADVNCNQGGTSSGKTYAILQVLFTHCTHEPGVVATVAGQDIPNLKVGALRDAKAIVAGSPDLQASISQYNESERVYRFRNGSLMEFKSYGDEQDARSGKRDYLFVNEANGIPYEVFEQLYVRTKKKTYLDYNPSCEFWVHTKLIGKPGVRLFISDYRHNPFVDRKVVDKIESKRADVEWYKVYGRGLTGKIEGLIFRNWFVCEKIPEDAKLIGYGLDFGFTNDPTALVEVYMQNGELWVNELIYETGLTNQDIHKRFLACVPSKNREIIADSAEPKSIEELRRERWWVTPALKGKDSVGNSIDILKRHNLNVTATSQNLRRELNQYRWKVKDGQAINEPVDIMNHAIDALRYVALNRLGNPHRGKYVLY